MTDVHTFKVGEAVFNGRRRGRVIAVFEGHLWVDFNLKDGPVTFRADAVTAIPNESEQ